MTREEQLAKLVIDERAAVRAKDHETADRLRAQRVALMEEVESQRGISLDEVQRSVRAKTRERLGLKALPAPQSADLALRPASDVLPSIESQQSPELESWWLPEPVRAWVDAISAANQAPKTLAIASALCAAATVLQGRVRVRWKAGVDEPLCLYWFVFSGTGTRKTTIQLRSMRAIVAHERALAEQCERDAKVVENKRRRLESQLARLRRQPDPGKHSPAGIEWRGKLAELEHDLDQLQEPKAPEWLQSNVNPSLLPKLMRHNFEAEGIARLSVLVSEGSFLKNLLGRFQGGPILEEVLGAMNGEPMRFVRSSKTSDDPVKVRLPHSYLTMCHLLQPHLLDELRAAELSDTGLIGRCLVDVLPGDPVKPAWDAPAVPEHIQEAYDRWLAALISEDLPELVDLTTDATTARTVRAIYERVEVDGTGTSQRITGLLCRIAAILDIGDLVAERLRGGKVSAPQLLGETPRSGTVPKNAIPKHIHVVDGSEYDWLDHISDDDDYVSNQSGTQPESGRFPAKQRGQNGEPQPNVNPIGDDLGRGKNTEQNRVSGSGETQSGTSGTARGVQSTSTAGRLEYLFTNIYVQRLQLVRSLDRPASPTHTLAHRVLLHSCSPSLINRPRSEGIHVAELHHSFTPAKRPSSDQLYAALEELEQAGAIEWVPESLRKYRGSTRYRAFKVLVKSPHLAAVPQPKEPNQ